MSFAYTCDWCGRVIHEADVRTTLSADHHLSDGLPSERLAAQTAGGWVGHYHRSGCWPRMLDTIRMAHELAPTLEATPTLSAQQVAARRRKHRRDDEGEG